MWWHVQGISAAGLEGLGQAGQQPQGMQQMMQQMMQNPMMQNMLNNPQMLRQILQSNPQVQQVCLHHYLIVDDIETREHFDRRGQKLLWAVFGAFCNWASNLAVRASRSSFDDRQVYQGTAARLTLEQCLSSAGVSEMGIMSLMQTLTLEAAC